MNIEKLKTFLKKYGFYVAVGVISVGAITAVFLMPGTEGDIASEPNPYAANKEADGKAIDEVGSVSEELIFDPSILEQKGEENNQVESEKSTTEISEVEQDIVTTENGEVTSNTFTSTTAEGPQEPFFVEGDTLMWPVEGEIIVPFKDETTSHWFSEGLSQTMRTFGVCISAEEGESVKAAATGTVEAIIDDASTIDSLVNVGDLGEVVIINHGNGYKTLYGMQKGTADRALLNQVVEVGEAIGVAGAAAGPFVSEGTNVYLQVMHEDEIVNPQDMLMYKEGSTPSSVEMGHAPDQQ
ncbi:MAG: peptidoglycan DD-metalloendopeptidase family protein [Cellulosilyticaceae bacterium]